MTITWSNSSPFARCIVERRKISGLSSSSWSCLRTVQLSPVCSKCVFRLFIILFFEAITQVFGYQTPSVSNLSKFRSIIKSKPVKEIISTFHRWLFLNLRLWRESDWWRHLRKHLGRNETNYFMYQWAAPDTPYPHQSSCISIKPVYSTSSVTWLTLMPVRSDIATRVRLRIKRMWCCLKVKWEIMICGTERHLWWMVPSGRPLSRGWQNTNNIKITIHISWIFTITTKNFRSNIV